MEISPFEHSVASNKPTLNTSVYLWFTLQIHYIGKQKLEQLSKNFDVLRTDVENLKRPSSPDGHDPLRASQRPLEIVQPAGRGVPAS